MTPSFGLAVLRCLAALFVLLGIASSAAAHPAPFSFLDIQLDAGRMRGAVVLHNFDVAHELNVDRPELLLDPALAERIRNPLVVLLERRLRLLTDEGAVHPDWGRIEILAERQSLRLPFAIRGAVPARLDIEARLFPYDPNHQSFVNIYEGGRLRQQAIVHSGRLRTSFYSGTPQGRWAVVRTFVQAGIQHILIGPDHIVFLIGLLLLGGSLWRLATIVTAFTAGHSITLSLAALGVVRLSPSVVEPVIALSIIVVGVDNLIVARQRRAASQEAAPNPSTPRDLRIGLAAIFGLVHGFGFASVLIQFGLPREALLWSLAAFNIGVEIGQLIIVIGLIVLAGAVARLPVYPAAIAARSISVASIAIIAAGLYWFAERIIYASA